MPVFPNSVQITTQSQGNLLLLSSFSGSFFYLFFSREYFMIITFFRSFFCLVFQYVVTNIDLLYWISPINSIRRDQMQLELSDNEIPSFYLINSEEYFVHISYLIKVVFIKSSVLYEVEQRWLGCLVRLMCSMELTTPHNMTIAEI